MLVLPLRVLTARCWDTSNRVLSNAVLWSGMNFENELLQRKIPTLEWKNLQDISKQSLHRAGKGVTLFVDGLNQILVFLCQLLNASPMQIPWQARLWMAHYLGSWLASSSMGRWTAISIGVGTTSEYSWSCDTVYSVGVLCKEHSCVRKLKCSLTVYTPSPLQGEARLSHLTHLISQASMFQILRILSEVHCHKDLVWRAEIYCPTCRLTKDFVAQVRDSNHTCSRSLSFCHSTQSVQTVWMRFPPGFQLPTVISCLCCCCHFAEGHRLWYHNMCSIFCITSCQFH